MSEVMVRRAADNQYLHRDFHGALSVGLMYLERVYGADAVREYLSRFASEFYAPLRQDLIQRGLAALREHYERIYAVEGGDVTFEQSPDELVLHVSACPAVGHMRQHGYQVSPLFHETTKTVNEAICAGTPFASELVAYAPESGRATVRFYRRPA